MNLQDISALWPPVPSPTVNMKTVIGPATPVITIQMDDIHDPGWWTGIRIVAPVPSDYIVEIVANSAIPLPAGEYRWIQSAGPWMTLPWPIPAKMARAADLQLRIHTLASTEIAGLKCELSCHDLEKEDVGGRYVFLGSTGRIAMHWNGALNGGGSTDSTLPLHRGVPHRIVPRMDALCTAIAGGVDKEWLTPSGWGF